MTRRTLPGDTWRQLPWLAVRRHTRLVGPSELVRRERREELRQSVRDRRRHQPQKCLVPVRLRADDFGADAPREALERVAGRVAGRATRGQVRLYGLVFLLRLYPTPSPQPRVGPTTTGVPQK